MDTITSVNYLKKIAFGGVESIRDYLLQDVININNQARLDDILESAVFLSNSDPNEKDLKEKIINYIINRRKNMYWLYLFRTLKRREVEKILSNDEYLRQLIIEDQSKSKSKSVFKKVSQLFAEPVSLNYGEYPLRPTQIEEVKYRLYQANLPASTMAKITAWMNYPEAIQIQNLMTECERRSIIFFNEYQKPQNELENTIDDEEVSLHTD